MARRKSSTVKMVRIVANMSFMDIRIGDESVCPLDATVQGWINAGFVTVLEVIDDGEDPAGQSGAESDDAGGVESEG